MLDQIMSDRKSKRLWSKCVLCIPYILSGNTKECRLHTCTRDTCIITTWILGLKAPLVTCHYFAKFLSAPCQNRELSRVDCCVSILSSWFLQDSPNWNGLYLQSIIKGFVLSVICSLLSMLDCCENLTTLVKFQQSSNFSHIKKIFPLYKITNSIQLLILARNFWSKQIIQ